MVSKPHEAVKILEARRTEIRILDILNLTEYDEDILSGLGVNPNRW